jgi:Cof subfamily protein (haloacid dehalogenase superfamily)
MALTGSLENAMAIRLIALDIDGTLTNQPRTVSERNRLAIRRAEEAGVSVILATGRGVFATRALWKHLDLSGLSIQFGGAQIVDIETERTLVMHEVPPEVIREVLDYSRQISVDAQIFVDETVICEKRNPFTERYIARHGMPLKIDPDIRRKTYRNVPKILALVDAVHQDDVMEAYLGRFRGIAQVSRSNPGFIEINALGVTKGSALAELSHMLGIAREETAAAGDNYLDLEMIKWAGLGACVADGAKEVRDAADLVIPACDEDGVAVFIEQSILN